MPCARAHVRALRPVLFLPQMAVGMYVHGKFIEKVRFFKGCKPSFLREVRQPASHAINP